ncbi:hypothetical protein [Alteribacillus sp. YIM 98480]|uniref:hypothetical protein n=1 Tax=Alteribacillus sp. YIM 98480 TaxID=2606599 RepID=UPI001E5D1A12|nr:hypothetical protein [Alteribacillus sp. YIM 98480]
MSINRARPFMNDESVMLLIERGASPSFPSDQALIMGVFAVLLWVVSKKDASALKEGSSATSVTSCDNAELTPILGARDRFWSFRAGGPESKGKT